LLQGRFVAPAKRFGSGSAMPGKCEVVTMRARFVHSSCSGIGFGLKGSRRGFLFFEPITPQ
jgi:hypothetical protein